MAAYGWSYLESFFFYFFQEFLLHTLQKSFKLIHGSYVLYVRVSPFATSNSESASVYNDMLTTLTPCAK
jgi:hypothetical protein